MIVRFAVICDHCGKRSAEYSTFPACRECGADVCTRCSTNQGEETGEGESMRADCFRCLREREVPTLPQFPVALRLPTIPEAK